YRIVQSVDLYSTLAELCGLTVPAGGEGTSLAALLRDPTAAWDRPAYSIWSEDSKTIHGTAVPADRWRYPEYGPQGVNGAMLFDERVAPLEMNNLAYQESHAAVVAELSALTRKYYSCLGT